MKMFVALLSLVSAIPALAAEGLAPADLLEATRISIASFEASNPDHAGHLSGFKSWRSGADGKVKLYVAHGSMTMEFNFVCAKHGEEIHCGAQ